MKAVKMIASIMVLCLILGCMSVSAFAAEAESILLDEGKTVSVPVDQSDFSMGQKEYTFTPEESGNYVFSVSYEASEDLMHLVTLTTGENEANDKLFFEAEAGVPVSLQAAYWGMYTESVDYVLCVRKCVPLQGIELVTDTVIGCVEEYIYVDVSWLPDNSAPETLTWTVSDPAVAEISYEDMGFAELHLLAAGTTVVTATTVSGFSASLEITVQDAEAVPTLNEGSNEVTVPVDEDCRFTFTPENSGYYRITADTDGVSIWLSADSVSDGTNEYYVLEAGVCYEGDIYNWTDDDVTCTINLEYCQDVVIVEPVAIELISLPRNTTYLRDTLYESWSDEKLAGMELKVTWSDGTVSEWNYDENFGFIGGGYVGGFLNEKEDGGFEVEVYVTVGNAEPVFFDLTVLDITAESIALLEDAPLRIVEYSCGLDLGALGIGGEGWVYFPLAAYNRQVEITFSDGSTVVAKPGDVVYGVEIICLNNQGGMILRDGQPEGFWSKDSENLITYHYGELVAQLNVEIIDSPVQSVELAGMPENTFKVDEEKGLINRDGQVVDTLKKLLEGLALKVNYTDGTSATFTWEQIQWCDAMGQDYPFVNDYPLGLLEGLLAQDQLPEVPGEMTMKLEYMGKYLTYTLYLVEKFQPEDTEQPDDPQQPGTSDKPDIEINPETGDEVTLLAMLVIGMMSAAVIIVKNEKLIG